ncbi:MAG: hypothetical protein BGN88_03560 [Clostridiales bacterium 43-6]|nr:MAG: hypothetical protein BGN88_03560 [Clostridiales bacterium 43-6]
MATTKLWHISGRIKDLIAYIENPEKTVPKDKQQEDFFNVFSYAQRADKTKDEYVSAINCLKNTALQQMIVTKKQYGNRYSILYVFDYLDTVIRFHIVYLIENLETGEKHMETETVDYNPIQRDSLITALKKAGFQAVSTDENDTNITYICGK